MVTYLGSEQALVAKQNGQFPAKTVVVIGNFDGVHLGHQTILKQAFELGESISAPVCVYTFNPHPTVELRPQAKLKLLMTYDEKRAQLEKMAVPHCVEEKFNTEFAATTAAEFLEKILVGRLNAKAIVVGSDFSFGNMRQGNLNLLQNYCDKNGVELKIVPPYLVDGAPVSSSRIRDTLQAGDLVQAKKLLGRPFFYCGEVVHGEKRGRTLGFPTANMKCEEKFPLPPGVYVSSVFWRNKTYSSVTNIGKRPTFQTESELPLIPLRIETHILDQTFDLYGEILEIRFLKRLREERKFLSVDELKAQIETDIFLAREFLK